MAEEAVAETEFVPVEELHARPNPDGTVAMWAVTGGRATHETVVEVAVATPFFNELVAALSAIGAGVGARR